METLQNAGDQRPDDPIQQEPLPEFPRLTGPLGKLVEAINPDIPYEHKALSVLTYVGLAFSGRTKLASPYRNLQPRFYTCLVGPPETGKSAAQERVGRALRGLGKVHVEYSLNSGPALVMTLDQHRRLLYLPDEATGALQKAKRGQMLADLLRLYESNEIGRVVVDETINIPDAHFAMIATATPRVFEDMWQGTSGGGGGLQSRFVLSFSEERMPLIGKDNDEQVVSEAVNELMDVLSSAPLEISLPEKVGDFTFGLIGEGWLNPEQFPARVVSAGRRFALILAACERKTQIDEETMKLGAAFIQYQMAAHERLMPPDAWSRVQLFENRIIAYFERHPSTTHRDARNNIKPDKSPGGFEAFNKAFNSLIKAGRLKEVDKNRVGTPLYKLDE